MLPCIGIVDTGGSSRILIPLLRSAGFSITGIWGTTQQRAKDVAEEFDIKFSTSTIDDLLLREDVDLVCVLCPPHQRAEVAVKTLSIGKHVLCDAPAGLNRQEAERMVSAARYYPKLMSLLKHELRLVPAFVKMKKLLEEGFCGEPLICECRVEMGPLLSEQYDWLCDEGMGGGMLTNVGAHIIDIVSFLTNQRAQEVQGTLKTFVTQADAMPGFRHISSDDFCAFQMKLNGGAFATVTLNSHTSGRHFQSIAVFGTKGQLVVKNGDLYKQKRAEKEQLVHRELRDGSATSNKGSRFPPSIFLTGLRAWVQEIKRAFEESEDKDDRRNADLHLISSAASFEDGKSCWWNTYMYSSRFALCL